MMIQKRHYTRAALSLALLMSSAQVIKAGDEVVPAAAAVDGANTVASEVKPAIEATVKQDEAPATENKEAERTEEKKVVKRQAIHNRAEKNVFGKCWAYVFGESVTHTPTDVRQETREELVSYPYVLNRFEELWKAQDDKNHELAQTIANELKGLSILFVGKVGKDMISSALRDGSLLAKKDDLEAKKDRGADAEAAMREFNVVIAKLQGDVASYTEQVKSGKIDATTFNTLIAAATKDLHNVNSEYILKPLAEQKAAEAELKGIYAALGFVFNKVMDPASDLAGVGSPEKNINAAPAATLPDDRVQKEEKKAESAEEVITEEGNSK